MTAEGCTLPYPERFQAAKEFVSDPPAGIAPLNDDTRLMLYALAKQATAGPCTDPKPWGWNAIENAKWNSWNQLGNTTKEDAMRLFVRTLEEAQPSWWRNISKYPATSTEEKAVPAGNHISRPVPTESEQRLFDAAAEGSWSTPYLDNAKKPVPRYEHAMASFGQKMMLFGGNTVGGRYLNDVWTFDLVSLEWSNQQSSSKPSLIPDTKEPFPPPFPPIAGHKAIAWKNSVLIMGGHVKSKDATDDMIVRVLDLESMEWSILETTGDAPCSRGGHSVILAGNQLLVFGGEDLSRRQLGDLYALDLDKLEWSEVTPAGQSPPPRSGHSCALVGDFMIIFGGASLARCYNDTAVLDTKTMTWYKAVMHGRLPSPRSGQASALLGCHWYVVGGGNNSAGCTDMAYLDISPLFKEQWTGVVREPGEVHNVDLSWTIVGTIPERSYIASEGMSLMGVEGAGVLVSFGGYNGKYSNALSLFRPQGESFRFFTTAETTSTGPQALGGADSKHMHTKTGSNLDTLAGSMPSKLETALQEAETVSQEAIAAKESAAHELALMRRQLLSAQTSLDEKSKALESCQSQLQTEQAKSFKLEAEIAELRKEMEKIPELEKEVQMYRRQAQDSRKSGGIWGWVAGNE